jgi:dehydrogenase/reductase SDR family member 1
MPAESVQRTTVMADLAEAVVWLNGADGALGEGIARSLLQAGATVYATSATAPAAELTAVCGRVAGSRGRIEGMAVDPAEPAALAQLLERIGAEHGRLDLLVNNALRDPGAPRQPFWQGGPDGWNAFGADALRGHYAAAVGLAPALVRQGRGLMVFLSGGGGGGGEPLAVPAAAARAASEATVRAMAPALQPHGVAVLALWPGRIRGALPAAADPPAAGAPAASGTGAMAPGYVGRCIAALAMDPDVLEKTGGAWTVPALAGEYRFTDPDRVGPDGLERS